MQGEWCESSTSQTRPRDIWRQAHVLFKSLSHLPVWLSVKYLIHQHFRCSSHSCPPSLDQCSSIIMAHRNSWTYFTIISTTTDYYAHKLQPAALSSQNLDEQQTSGRRLVLTISNVRDARSSSIRSISSVLTSRHSLTSRGGWVGTSLNTLDPFIGWSEVSPY